MNSAQTGMCFRLGFFSYLYLFLSDIDVGAIYMYYWRILLLLLVVANLNDVLRFFGLM